MSDTPQGPDWWQASDDKWYPPPRPDMPGDAATAGTTAPADAAPGGPPMAPPGAPTGPPMAPPGAPQGPPSGGYPAGPPLGPPAGPPPGPYGAPPGPPPGAPRQNKTPLYIAIGVVAVIALVAIVVLVTNGGDEDDPVAPTTTDQPGTTGSPDPTGEPGTTGTTEDAPSGDAAVEVVEQGFLNFRTEYDDQLTATYGFIVENTGDDTATDVEVSISAYDANDGALASASHTIWVLRPGQKMGVGDEFYGENFPAEVARLDIQVSEPSDYPSEVPDEGKLTAEGVSTTSDDYGMTTKFTVKSTFAEQVDGPYAYAIYRNGEGKIIGGSYDILDFVPANGTAAGEILGYEIVDGVASTEVYIDPGIY